MFKKVLSEIDMYYGDVKMPKGFEINRKLIKGEIIYNSVMSNEIKNTEYEDYKIKDTTILYPLHTYLTDFMNLKFKKSIYYIDSWGTVVYPGQQTMIRDTLNPISLDLSADYTIVYGVDIHGKENNLVIKYDQNRRAGRSWVIPMDNNKFVMFPSTCKYYITKNLSNTLNTYLGFTFNYTE